MSLVRHWLLSAARAAEILLYLQVAVNLGYFLLIVHAFFQAGKHLSKAVSSRQVEDLLDLLKKV